MNAEGQAVFRELGIKTEIDFSQEADADFFLEAMISETKKVHYPLVLGWDYLFPNYNNKRKFKQSFATSLYIIVILCKIKS